MDHHSSVGGVPQPGDGYKTLFGAFQVGVGDHFYPFYPVFHPDNDGCPEFRRSKDNCSPVFAHLCQSDRINVAVPRRVDIPYVVWACVLEDHYEELR